MAALERAVGSNGGCRGPQREPTIFTDPRFVHHQLHLLCPSRPSTPPNSHAHLSPSLKTFDSTSHRPLGPTRRDSAMQALGRSDAACIPTVFQSTSPVLLQPCAASPFLILTYMNGDDANKDFPKGALTLKVALSDSSDVSGARPRFPRARGKVAFYFSFPSEENTLGFFS